MCLLLQSLIISPFISHSLHYLSSILVSPFTIHSFCIMCLVFSPYFSFSLSFTIFPVFYLTISPQHSSYFFLLSPRFFSSFSFLFVLYLIHVFLLLSLFTFLSLMCCKNSHYMEFALNETD